MRLLLFVWLARAQLVITLIPTDLLFPTSPVETVATMQARQLLLSTPFYPELEAIHEMTPEQLEAFCVLHEAFLTRSLIQTHRAWHTNHSIGGIHGDVDPGDGSIFAGFHQAIIVGFETYVRGNSGMPWKLPPWHPEHNLPALLGVIPARYSSMGTQRTNNPNYTEPSFFTAEGDIINGQHVSYMDAKSAEIFGQLFGLQNHNGPHAGLPDVMPDSSRSPIARAFFIWHGTLQRKFEAWQLGPDGAKWVSEHPGHPLLTRFDLEAFVSTADFRGDLTCQTMPVLDAVCTFLLAAQALVNSANTAPPVLAPAPVFTGFLSFLN